MYAEIIGNLSRNDVEYKTDYMLAPRTTVRIGGSADLAIFPKSIDELVSVLEFLIKKQVHFRVVGALSNTLPKDNGFRGALIFTDSIGKAFINGECVILECGVRLSSKLTALAEAEISSFDPFYGIPGLIGGLVYNNAGAFSVDISDVLESARIYDCKTGKIYSLTAGEMKLSYRNSILRENKSLVLLDAKFKIKRGKKEDILSAVKEYARCRRESQPLEYPSLGSVFKRPKVGFSGAYIEKAGLKGYTVGGAQISEKHAGFIINIGAATASDFLSLVEIARGDVYKKYGIMLETEIEVLE